MAPEEGTTDPSREDLCDLAPLTAPPSGTIAVWICALLLCLYALYVGRALFAPLTIAFLIYLALRPVVVRLEHRRIPPVFSALAFLVLFLTLAVGSVATIIQPARQWVRQAPQHFDTLGDRLAFLNEPMKALDSAADQLNDEDEAGNATTNVDEPIEVRLARPEWINQWVLVNSTGSFVATVLLIVVPAFFLLAAGDGLINNVLHILPTFGEQRNTVALIRSLQDGVGRYLGQVAIINFCLGVAVGSAMWLIGMPSPILWGVMAMMFNFIPFLGAITGAVIIFLVSTVTFEEFSMSLLATGTFVLLTGLEGQLITPAVLGRTMSLNPIVVLFSVVFWAWMWGVIGAFVAVPLLISLRLSLRQFQRTRIFAGLFAAADEEFDDGLVRHAARHEEGRSDAAHEAATS